MLKTMPPLAYLVLGFVGGYWAGWHTRGGREVKALLEQKLAIGAALRREASALLESVGKLSQTGALSRIDDLKLTQGSDKDGVQLSIKTYAHNAWANVPTGPET